MKALIPTVIIFLPATLLLAAGPRADLVKGTLRSDSIPHATVRFQGPVGQRIANNVEHWLLTAPIANPGMLEMFRLRDRKPVPKLVPWAGEFAGKYLISAVQARRMTDDPRLDKHLRWFVARLVATQADDGYLGPFRKNERLLGHWDLWGHYHGMLGLLMWYEDTDDEAARDCAVRAADLICKTYLDTDRRPIDAGSSEMNLSAIHALGRVYRHTGGAKYLEMMKVFLKDFEHPKAGDYYRQGLAGVDFYLTPKPRWESLHCIEGLHEMFLITGDETFRTALVNLWRSINRFDIHNTGGFTTGERAIGSPYEPGAIETCCTTAWATLTVDMLRLTADPVAADALERSTWNSILGSQHPSGRWWTYNTPMDGKREASAHTIVFQARAGTPELNCCSVNAPRGVGLISEWGIMRDPGRLFVNYYGPMTANVTLCDGTAVKLRQETAYPVDGRIALHVDPAKPAEFELRLRIPEWSKQNAVKVNGREHDAVEPGSYLALKRTWNAGDTVELSFDMSIHAWVGDGSCSGKVSLYRGPLLLAFDQHHNSFDADAIPTFDLKQLDYSRHEPTGLFKPLVLLRFKGTDGREVNLVDFASAGAYGTDVRSWLPATNAPPPPFHLRVPRNGAKIPTGPNKFEWTGSRRDDTRTYTFILARDRKLADVVTKQDNLERPWALVREGLEPGKTYRWQVISRNAHGELASQTGPWTFTVDASLKNDFEDHPALIDFRADGLVTSAPLDGDGKPEWGYLAESRKVKPATDRHGKAGGAVEFDGDGMLRYRVPYFPDTDYSVTAWICPLDVPDDRISQVFSAWCRGMDDPLRITLDKSGVNARLEAGGTWGTKTAPVKLGEWVHVAAVKKGERLRFYLDGKEVGSTWAPYRVASRAVDFALGANPHYSGNEHYLGRIDDVALYARALTADEIANAAGK